MASLFSPFCLLDAYCFIQFSSTQLCFKTKKCSKNNKHLGKCDSKRVLHRFWETSAVYKIKNQQKHLIEDIASVESKIRCAEQKLVEKQTEAESLVTIAEGKVSSASKYQFNAFLYLICWLNHLKYVILCRLLLDSITYFCLVLKILT